MKYTKAELKIWWPARCPQCRWRGLSRDCGGGHALADTGDFCDVICPACERRKLHRIVEDAGDSRWEAFCDFIMRQLMRPRMAYLGWREARDIERQLDEWQAQLGPVEHDDKDDPRMGFPYE